MKMVHKTHGWVPDRTDPEWAERVEREAERTTDQTEARHRKAQERLERAIEKARSAEARVEGASRTRKVKRLWDAVEERRAELLALERLMTRTGANSQQRGRGAHRGVPDVGSGL